MWKIKRWVCFKGLQDVSCWSNLCCIINFPASSFWFCAVFFFFFSFYGALSILPTSSFWFFAAALFCSTVDTFLLSDMRSPNSVQNENCKLSLCRISNFCARCLQSVFGAIFAIWLQTLRCKNFTIFVEMWPVLPPCKTQIFEDAPTKTKHIECKRRLFEI